MSELTNEQYHRMLNDPDDERNPMTHTPKRVSSYDPVQDQPEWQRLNSESARARNLAGWFGMVVGHLMQSRDWWRDQKDDVPESVGAVYEKAAKSLGPAIKQALDERDRHLKLAEEAHLKLIEYERSQRTPLPDNMRYSGMGVEAFNEKFGVTNENV